MEITANNTQRVSYDANGNKRVEERKSESPFSEDLTEAEKQKREMKTADKLLESLMFTFRTGMTKEEYEKLLDEIKELQDKIKEGNYSEDEVTEMLNELERNMLRLKKSISGEAIKELSNSLGELAQNIEENPKENSLTQQLLDRLDELEKQLEDMNKGEDQKGYRSGSSAQELELLQRLKNTSL